MRKSTFRYAVFQTLGGRFIALCTLEAFLGATVPLIMVLTQRMIDSLGIGTGGTFLFLALLGAVFFVELACSNLINYLRTNMQNHIEKNLGEAILIKCNKMEYACYELSETFELVSRTLDKYVENAMALVQMVATGIRLFVTFAGIFYYLVMVRWWVFPLLMFTMVPTLILAVLTSMREHSAWKTFFPFLMKAEYLSGLLTHRRNIKEARLFQYQAYIGGMWEEYIQRFHKGQMRSNLIPRFVAGFCIMLQYVVTIANLFVLAPSVATHALTMGVFIAVAQSMWRFVGEFQYDLVGLIKSAKACQLFAQDYKAFIAMPETRKPQAWHEPVSFQTIELQNLWFRYSPSGRNVLKGVNMMIHRGEKIGLVGENGSGKSTLVKILLGLLVPTQGRVLVDGEPIDHNNRDLLRQMMSAVFQDFGRFNLTLEESVALHSQSGALDVQRVEPLLRQLHGEDDFLRSFPEGKDTKLGKELWDGKDLSGGQWQTLSLARAIYSQRPLLILDEPTAALDPLAEVDVYQRIYHSQEVSSVILATHRLGGIAEADTIYLLADGSFLEQGNHRELIEKNGRYAELFALQSSWYYDTQEVRSTSLD